jgi:NitT/TauT family transport system ATP-binding protein
LSFVTLEDVDLVYGGGDTGSDISDGTLAVTGVGLSLERGDFVAVVGPSGCGKSSLLKLVAGLVPTTAGRVLVDGEPVKGPLKIVGMAFQNATLLPWRTARDNMLLPLEIVEPHRRRFRKDYKIYCEWADKLLDTVGLKGFGDRYPWQLSGGMQQRVQLCRALIHQPELLLLDEPFGALDTFTREELWNVLQTLYTERQCTVILVTHDLREAAFLSNRVMVMSARPGHIMADRTVPLGRPRSLDDTYLQEMVDLVHEMRSMIMPARDPS